MSETVSYSRPAGCRDRLHHHAEAFGNWILANQHMAAVLKAKGYAYRYVYAEGARHTDANVIYQTLPQALEYVWQGFPIK